MRKGDLQLGFPGTVYLNTTANLAGLAGLTAGAMAYDTTLGRPAWYTGTAWESGAITGGGTVALGGFTLTVPATGTAALLNQANVFTARNLFTAATAAAAGSVQITATDASLRFKTTGGVANQNTYEIRNSSYVGNTYLQFRTINDANSVFTTRMALWNSGGLYLGTTPVDPGAGNLQVSGIVGIRGAPYVADGSYSLTVNGGKLALDNNTGIRFKTFAGTYTSVFNANADDTISFGASTNWTALRFFPGAAEAMSITVAGNVGIGVTDPDTLLELYKVGTQLKLSGGAADYMTVAVAADGATTFTTVDADAALAHIILAPDGYVVSNARIGVGLTPTANMLGVAIESGLLTLKETTTPTADADYGKIYTKNDNKLYFQDGAGVEHEIALVA